MRIAESAAGWLRRRDPKAWLSLAIVVLIDDGHSHHVVPRVEAVNRLEKARAKASQTKFVELERDLAVGIDLVKAAAPIEVPVVAFFATSRYVLHSVSGATMPFTSVGDDRLLACTINTLLRTSTFAF